MRKIYSCSNIIELSPYKFALEAAGIKYLIKNEFSQGAVGELPPTESWSQIWVINQQDADKAKHICSQVELKQKASDSEWLCSHCNETNASSFEYCWQCQTLKPE